MLGRLPGHDVLRAPEDGGGGGGGDEKKFSQADVDRFIQDRVGKLTDKLKALEPAAAKVAELEAKLAEADAERERAKEEEALKGKSELDKLKHQLEKATEKSKTAEVEWGKRLAEATAAAEAASGRHVDYVKRHLVSTALSDAGLAQGAGKAASLAFLTEAQLELDDNHEIKSVAVAGKSFPKLGEAAKQFLEDNPFFRAASPGGSGHPRGNNGTPATPQLGQFSSSASLIGAGLQERSKTS